jgi:hypothetical protein
MEETVLKGTQVYNTPGEYTFTVPRYNKMSAKVIGAGGGGAGGSTAYVAWYPGGSGSAGGVTNFFDLVAMPGEGGGPTPSNYNGKPGTASGGITNVEGGGAFGGPGGSGNGTGPSGDGGPGGFCSTQWLWGDQDTPTINQVIKFKVGEGGAGGGGSGQGGGPGGPGAPGAVEISWS